MDYSDLEIPVSCLPDSLRRHISLALDRQTSVAKNWRDLAEKLGYTHDDILTFEHAAWRNHGKSETILLLEDYETKDGATIAKVAQALDDIDRQVLSRPIVANKQAIVEQHSIKEQEYQSMSYSVRLEAAAMPYKPQSAAVAPVYDSMSTSYTDMNVYEHPLPSLSTRPSARYVDNVEQRPMTVPSIHDSMRPIQVVLPEQMTCSDAYETVGDKIGIRPTGPHPHSLPGAISFAYKSPPDKLLNYAPSGPAVYMRASIAQNRIRSNANQQTGPSASVNVNQPIPISSQPKKFNNHPSAMLSMQENSFINNDLINQPDIRPLRNKLNPPETNLFVDRRYVSIPPQDYFITNRSSITANELPADPQSPFSMHDNSSICATYGVSMHRGQVQSFSHDGKSYSRDAHHLNNKSKALVEQVLLRREEEVWKRRFNESVPSKSSTVDKGSSSSTDEERYTSDDDNAGNLTQRNLSEETIPKELMFQNSFVFDSGQPEQSLYEKIKELKVIHDEPSKCITGEGFVDKHYNEALLKENILNVSGAHNLSDSSVVQQPNEMKLNIYPSISDNQLIANTVSSKSCFDNQSLVSPMNSQSIDDKSDSLYQLANDFTEIHHTEERDKGFFGNFNVDPYIRELLQSQNSAKAPPIEKSKIVCANNDKNTKIKKRQKRTKKRQKVKPSENGAKRRVCLDLQSSSLQPTCFSQTSIKQPRDPAQNSQASHKSSPYGVIQSSQATHNVHPLNVSGPSFYHSNAELVNPPPSIPIHSDAQINFICQNNSKIQSSHESALSPSKQTRPVQSSQSMKKEQSLHRSNTRASERFESKESVASIRRSNSESTSTGSSSASTKSSGISRKSSSDPKVSWSEYKEGRRNIRVFLTYAKDSCRHLKRVLSLFKCLTDNGFSCSMDMKERRLLLPEHLPSYDINGRAVSPSEEWFNVRYKSADFVILCISKLYHEKIQESQEDFSTVPKDDLHTCYVYSRMREEYLACHSRNIRFIPVIFSGASEMDVPEWLQNNSRIYQWPTEYKDLFWMMIRMMKKRQEALDNIK